MAQVVQRFAPGRVNLIGEHTDYCGGLVLPVAIPLGTTVSGRADSARIVLRSTADRTAVELAADGSSGGTTPDGWGRYVAAIARLLAERGRPVVGLVGEVESTLPIGAGLSSSAALLVAVALSLCDVADFDVDPLELAHLVREAERLAVGVPCGLMDPAAILFARRGCALFLDCATEEHRAVPLSPDLAIVVLDSGVRHRLSDSGYANRRVEVERALAAIGRRDASGLGAAEAAELAEAAGLDGVEARRLRHVVTENERVRECVAALEAGRNVEDVLRRSFRASQDSLRDDFQVSTPELDLLVELASDAGATAARMTGGGFGGSVIALVHVQGATELADSVTAAYRERTGRAGHGIVCASADGVETRATRGARR
ncbi:MAG: galactokinase [Gaiellaceae bacterium]